MNLRYISTLVAFSLILNISLIIAQNNKNSLSSHIDNIDSTLVQSVNNFVDDWHSLASNADLSYFDKIADNGIYIGTDATELWNKEEFIQWSRKYFKRGNAWSFDTIERNVYFSKDKQYAWFDELLYTSMGVCRASGVLHKDNISWKIEHYHLSITIPNENIEEVKKVISKE